MAKATKLTDRQQQILGLLDEGKTPPEIAEIIGVTPASIYQTRRRLSDGGHFTARARTKRAAALEADSGAVAVADEPTEDDEAAAEPLDDSIEEYEPVLVIQRHKNSVDAEIEHLTDLIEQASGRLGDLHGERERLTNALSALVPDDSSVNGGEPTVRPDDDTSQASA